MSDGVVWWPELEQWLLAHGIDLSQVAEVRWRPPNAGNTGDPQRMEVVYFKLRDGSRYLGEDGEVATETKLITMRHLPTVRAEDVLQALLALKQRRGGGPLGLD